MDDAAAFSVIKNKLKAMTDENVNLSSRIFHDLHLAGDDYYEFVIWYSHNFKVNLTGMDLSKFSPPDALDLSIFRRKKYLELTVRDLVELAKYPSWEESGLAKRLARR